MYSLSRVSSKVLTRTPNNLIKPVNDIKVRCFLSDYDKFNILGYNIITYGLSALYTANVNTSTNRKIDILSKQLDNMVQTNLELNDFVIKNKYNKGIDLPINNVISCELSSLICINHDTIHDKDIKIITDVINNNETHNTPIKVLRHVCSNDIHRQLVNIMIDDISYEIYMTYKNILHRGDRIQISLQQNNSKKKIDIKYCQELGEHIQQSISKNVILTIFSNKLYIKDGEFKGSKYVVKKLVYKTSNNIDMTMCDIVFDNMTFSMKIEQILIKK